MRSDDPSTDAAELLRAIALDRDVAAFSELFDHYAPRLHRYLLAMATEPGRAEELVQDVMLTIWQEARSYDPARASADAWIFTIARNRRIDLLRRERRPMPARDAAVLTSASAESQVEIAQTGAHVVKAMSELPDPQAEVLRRMYFEDKSLADIAAESGLPLGTVKSRARLALARLRAVLGGRTA